MKRVLLVLCLLSLTKPAVALQKAEVLEKISLGMTKEEVVGEMGPPNVVRGAITNKYDQTVEVWQYTLALPSEDSAGEVVGKSALTCITLGVGAATFKPPKRKYWLYFVDDSLVQWGEAGDWRAEADRIYEMRFETEPRLTE